MITTPLARALRDSGLAWHPTVGDAFCIDRIEADADVFYLSDLTVEAHEFSTGTVLGFNGTTEWALDSVAIEDALWLPSEAQLRILLGASFRGLEVDASGYRVIAEIDGVTANFAADLAEDAYARALLAVLDALAG
ncbi:MAG TPA: pilus assembly protein CpaE [Galbitalea sp.]